MNKDTGFKIKKLREAENISQAEMAHHLEISQSYLSKIENGFVEKIDFKLIQKISTFFNKNVLYFYGKKNDGIPENNLEFDTILKNIFKNQEQINHLVEIQNNLILQLVNK
ncbi:hypothetical protein BA768_13040 [Chryseobacterium sp. CBo1]|uniref:helix-turn-helix domain-containing protein n=1 Tax=Chryseobacterium sp. CBo1 TaxID=1869230 RepID=UPI000810ECBD|nr:helix-turn-helix transcriptional regulator [Chryseobacterium sp. CBo1]OCK52271.1 hypothetical protein BA768_13040 [Chryseobacterium sp. CBo1]